MDECQYYLWYCLYLMLNNVRIFGFVSFFNPKDQSYAKSCVCYSWGYVIHYCQSLLSLDISITIPASHLPEKRCHCQCPRQFIGKFPKPTSGIFLMSFFSSHWAVSCWQPSACSTSQNSLVTLYNRTITFAVRDIAQSRGRSICPQIFFLFFFSVLHRSSGSNMMLSVSVHISFIKFLILSSYSSTSS